MNDLQNNEISTETVESYDNTKYEYNRPVITVKNNNCDGIKCKGNCKKDSTEEFIKKAQEVHGNKYDYSLVNYNRNQSKVTIKCNVNKTTQEEFIKKAQEVHGNKYDYSLVNYNRNQSKVTIKCDRSLKNCNKFIHK